MRLFVATDFEDAERGAIVDLQAQLAARVGGRSGPSWTKPGQMHLTLAFIGEVDEGVAAGVVSAMSAPSSVQAFTIALEGIGMFPPRGAPRVVWLGITSGAAELMALQRDIAERLARVGVVLEQRPFHPHLTLARWRDARPSDRRRVERLPEVGVVARARVDHATLYRSQLSPSGSVYTPLSRVTLQESQAGRMGPNR